MIFGHFNRKRKNRKIVDGLYGQLTAVARNPDYFTSMNVPDSVMGRFEMLSVVMVLFFRRTDGAGPAVKQLAQDIVDTFFEDIDHSLRELGIGDVSVPKRMKKLARMFYGRAQAYGEALGRRDEAGLAEALARNIYPPGKDAKPGEKPAGNADMAALAAAMFALDRAMMAVADDDLLLGRLGLPATPPATAGTGPEKRPGQLESDHQQDAANL